MFCRSAIYAVLSMVSAVSLSAQSERERLIDSLSSPEISATGSMLKFDVTVMAAGTMAEESSPEEFEFIWTNVGESPVSVTKVTTTCGCAIPSFETGPVQPGEKSSLKITYHPKGHPGKFDRRIFVYTDISGSRPAVMLRLVGNVIPSSRPVWAFPYQMGNLYLKQKEVKFSGEARAVERIFCLNAGDKPLKIGAETALLPPYLKFRCEPETIPPGEYADLVISFDPDASAMRLLKAVPVILTGIDLPPSRRTVTVVFE